MLQDTAKVLRKMEKQVSGVSLQECRNQRLLMELEEKGTSLVHITIVPWDPKITCKA